MEPLNNPVAVGASWFWAVCGVANARHSYGYGCALRLAAHPKPRRADSLRIIQRFLRENTNCQDLDLGFSLMPKMAKGNIFINNQ
jgi:hypothetical protein